MKKIMIIASLICAVISCTISCDKDDNNAPALNTFVLVHGAWQAPYVWDTVKAQLEANSQKVVVVELPAHGDDNTSPVTVSMDAYRDKVIAAMSTISGKVILVGHSMGGAVVTEVAEKVPSQIDKLIYIGAFVPANGQTLGYLSSQDKQSHLGPSIIPAPDGLTLSLVHDSIVPVFCEDCSVEVQQLVLDRFRPEPAIPFGDTIRTTDANWGKVNKYYIHTTMDNAIGLDLQNQMVVAAHITNIYSLPTSHCPFLSKPMDVTNLLLQIAK